MLKGYQGKILRVDLTRRAFVEEPLALEDLEGFLGGRGLAALYYFNEIGPEVDALGEANKLIFMTGPLTATPLVGTTKFQLSTRSPETRMYLCSNCGGDFGIRLKQAGYDGLIVEGRAADWTWLSIVPGAVGFHDARPWKGYSSRRTLEVLHGAFGVRAAGAMAIGPAGEHLVRISCINVDERAFGRGGPGAVMGSKLLKGVIVRGEGTVPLADPGRVEEIGKAALRALSESNAADLRLGTSRHLEPINELGCMPTRNFQTGTFEKMEKVDAFAMREYSIVRNSACAHCAVACGKTCVVKEGPFAGAHARTEFESIALLGPNCGVADFGAIVKAAQLCDDLGVCIYGDDCNDIEPAVNPDASEICADGIDNDCDGLTDLWSPDCMPANDTCASPTALPGEGTFIGSLRGMADDYGTGCGTPALGDVVFSFTLTEDHDAGLRVMGSSDAFISVQTACGNPATELYCGLNDLWARGLHAGTYYVIVEGAAAEAFRMSLEIAPFTNVYNVPPTNDSCLSPYVLPDTGGLFIGTTVGMLNDFTASCGNLSQSPDAAFELTLAAARTVDITTTTDYDGTLHIRNAPCGIGAEIACNDDGPDIRHSHLNVALAAGTYSIVVDGYGTTSAGSYEMNVVVTP